MGRKQQLGALVLFTLVVILIFIKVIGIVQ
jgi:hypothetical protein